MIFKKLLHFFSKVVPLSFFKKHFDHILHFVEVVLLGFFGVYISIQANDIARSQLDWSRAVSMPAIYVTEEEFYNSAGSVDTRKLCVYNDNGYMTNYKSERFSDITVTTSSDFKRYDIRIPLDGLWTVGFYTGKMVGLIETRGYDNNIEKYKSIISDAESVFSTSNTDADYLLCNIETYIKISFLDVQHKEQNLYYKLNPIMGTIMVEADEYNTLLNQHNLNKNDYCIDIDSSTGNDLVQIVNSLVNKTNT